MRSGYKGKGARSKSEGYNWERERNNAEGRNTEGQVGKQSGRQMIQKGRERYKRERRDIKRKGEIQIEGMDTREKGEIEKSEGKGTKR